MRTTLVASTLALAACGGGAATRAAPASAPAPAAVSSVPGFQFRLERAAPGTLYEYLKSNVDGTHGIRVLVYEATPERVEVLKLEPENSSAAYVTARMNWRHFAAESLESWNVAPGRERRPQARLGVDFASRRAVTSVGNLRDTTAFGAEPPHVYNFDAISLGLALRHMADERGSVTVTILDPTFGQRPGILFNRGPATIRYVADERRAGGAARKYRISGVGIGNVEGWIWLDRDGRFVRDIEIPFPDNPDWQTFKLALRSIERLEYTAWQARMTREIEALR